MTKHLVRKKKKGKTSRPPSSAKREKSERVIRYTGELDKAIKRGNNRESEPWGDYTAVFPPAPNEPSVHKCF